MIVQKEEITWGNDSALARYLRVKNSSGNVVVAGATDNELGTLRQATLADEATCSIVTKRQTSTRMMVAAGAIAQYANVYGAAGGKIDDVVNSNFIGVALEAATANNAEIEVLNSVLATELDNLGAIDGNLVVDDDFTEDWPASETVLPVGSSIWLKTETDGLGITDSAEANGVKKFAFDAQAEVAVASMFMPSLPIRADGNAIFECRLAIFDIGDDVALDFDFGLANESHATDFPTIGEFAAFHLDGADLTVFAHSDDGTIDTAAVTTGVDLVDDTYANFKIDFSDLSDVKFFINGVAVATGTTFDISDASGPFSPIFFVAKTANDTTADMRLDRVRVQAERI